jgi:hypothetical protein
MPTGADSNGTIDQLTKRVEELEAARDLATLRTEFHRSLNNCQWDRLSNLFADGAYLDYGEFGQARGPAEVRSFYSQLLDVIRESKNATAISLKNFIHGHQVKIQERNSATGVCFYEEQIRFNNDTEIFSSVGQFTDEYVRRDGHWYFARIELDHYWVVPNNDGWRWPW